MRRWRGGRDGRARQAKGRLIEVEVKTALARIDATLDPRAMAGVDLVIEAVFEDLDVKHGVVRQVEETSRSHPGFSAGSSSPMTWSFAPWLPRRPTTRQTTTISTAV